MNLTRRIVVHSAKYTFARQFTASTCSRLLIKPGPNAFISSTATTPLFRSLCTQSLYRKVPSSSPPSTIGLCSLVKRLQIQQTRNITVVSRLGKRKTCKSVLKRFRRVKGGYLKRWRSGMVKKQRKKSSWRKFRLRGSILVKRGSHLKTLNKMMYKY